MRFNLMCALLAASMVPGANAGRLLDERVEAAPKPAAVAASAASAASSPKPTAVAVTTAAQASLVPRGSVTGYVANPGWAKLAPDVASMKGVSPGMAENFVAFGDAIFRLLPEGHPAVLLSGPREALSVPVTWTAGFSRAEALEQVAANYGLVIAFTGSKPGSPLLVSKVAAPVVAPKQPAVSVPATVVATAAAAAPPPAKPQGPVMTAYEIRLTDMRLSTAMARWAAEGGVRIRWDADKHLLISAPQTFTAASVADAVAMALATPGIRNSEFPLEACEYPNTPPLIRITRQGEQAKDCPQ